MEKLQKYWSNLYFNNRIFSNTKEILETRTIEISQICLKENNNLLILRYIISICEQNINIYELIL